MLNVRSPQKVYAALFLLAYWACMFAWWMHIQQQNLLEPSWHIKRDVQGTPVRDADGNYIKELDTPR
jgi:hypothetical protein